MAYNVQITYIYNNKIKHNGKNERTIYAPKRARHKTR